MLLALVLRSLRGWLHDYVGIDLDHSDYHLEHLSSNHVRLELKDVVLSSALWRFLVGPILPLTVQDGAVKEVELEVNPDLIRVRIQGVRLRLRKLLPEEWHGEAEAYKTRLLKEKRAFFRNALPQTELRRWIKAKIRVSVQDAEAVLVEPHWEQSRCAILGYCEQVHVADPDHDSWEEVPGQEERCSAPWHAGARDAQLQMAKDVLISGVRAFFLGPEKMDQAQEALEELRDARWEPYALCPELQVSAAYRNFDYGVLQAAGAPARGCARRVLAVRACCSGSPERPLALKLNGQSYEFLVGFLANMDSLYFMWSACMAEVCRPVGRKPSDEEAERYMELWAQYQASAQVVMPFELARLEDELLWGFCQRLRRIASEEITGQPATAWCRGSMRLCSGEPSRPEAEKVLSGSLEEPPHFEEELFRSRHPKLSPAISAHLAERCLRGEPEAEESPKGRCPEFDLDSVYHVALPRFTVLLDLAIKGTAVLESVLPDFEVIYGSQLDCRFLSVSSSCGRFVEAQYGAQSCAEAFRGVPVLHWEKMRLESTNFGDMKRQVRLLGEELSLDLRRLWPYLRSFPGLRDAEVYPEAIRRWFAEEIPSELSEALAVVGSSRQTTWKVELPVLRVPLGSNGMPMLEVTVSSARLSYSSLYGAHGLSWSEAELLHGNKEPLRPLLRVRQLDTKRLGDLRRNWAQVHVQHVEVDLKASQLLLLSKHLGAYDPQVRFSSSSKERRPMPQMAIAVKQVSVRYGSQPTIQLELHALETSTVKAWVMGGDEADCVVRFKLKSVVGHSGSGRSVFLCSQLEEGPLTTRNALEFLVTWSDTRKRVVLNSMGLHFSPTQGLLDTYHLLMPVLAKNAGPEAEAVPGEYQEGDDRPEGCPVESAVCLVIRDVDLQLHLGSGEYGPALELVEGLEGGVGRPSAAYRLCARLTLEAEAQLFEGLASWRPAQLSLKRLALAAAQVPASSLKELHAAGLMVTWLAMLQDVQGALILDASERGSRRCRAASCRVGEARLYSTGLSEGQEGRSSGLLERSELLRYCPARPVGEEEPHFFRVVTLEGTEKAPFMSFSWQGVWFEGEKGEGFYALEPFLEDGCAVFSSNGRRLSCRRGQSWSMRGQGLSRPVRFHMERQVMRVDLAPVLFLLRRMDLLPLLRLLRDLKSLAQLVKPSTEPVVSSPKEALAMRPPLHWQLFLRADGEVRLAELPGCPSLKLRCTPAAEVVRGDARVVLRLEEVSFELLAASAEGHGLYTKALTHLGLSNLELQLADAMTGLETTVAIGNITATHGCESQMWLRQMKCGAQHLLFKYCPGSLLDFRMETTALRLHRAWMEPLTSMLWGIGWWRRQSRLKEEGGGTGLACMTQLPQPEGVTGSSLEPAWLGTAWLLHGEPSSDLAAPSGERCALQIQADGTLFARRRLSAWTPLLNSAAVSNFRHFSSCVFPHGLCVTCSDFASNSSCVLALDGSEEKDQVVRLFTSLHLQRLRRGTPPSQTVVSVPRTTTRTKTSIEQLTEKVRNLKPTGRSSQKRSPASSFRTPLSPFSRRSPRSSGQASGSPASEAGRCGRMEVHVEVRGLEFWLPSEVEVLSSAEEAILEDDNRELGILVVASGEGDTGGSVQVNLEHVAAVCVPVNRCWWPEDAKQEPFPEPGGRRPWPELRLEADDLVQQSAFGALERWAREAPSPGDSPPRPSLSSGVASEPAGLFRLSHDLDTRTSTASLLKSPRSPAERLISPEHEVTALQDLAKGEAVEGQLVETRGLQMMLLFEPDKIIGLRLESFYMNAPLELMRWWRGFKEHTSTILEFSSLGPTLLEAPGSLHWAQPMQLPASRGPLRPQLEEPEAVRKWPTLFSGAVLRSSTSTLRSSERSVERAESVRRMASKTQTWRLELDCLGEMQLRLSGGIFSPAQWVALRISDFHVRGALAPAENDPLSFLLMCDVVCHNAAAAQLVPLLERFELTVDLERKRNEICCSASTARVNVNVDRVLVDFFRTVRHGLKEVKDGQMQPVRSFNFQNSTGVPIRVKWRQGRQSTSVELPPGMASNRHHLTQDRTHRFAEVSFYLEEFQMEETLSIDLDPTLGRAYQLREGCPIFVEPDHNLKEGNCVVKIASALTIYNDTALPLRITLGTAAFQRFSSQVTEMLRSSTRIMSFSQNEDEVMARIQGFHSKLDIPPGASAEVPVSWFVYSRTQWPSVRLQAMGPGFAESRNFPQLAALLEEVAIAEDEDFDDEDASASVRQRGKEQEHRGDRTKFGLFLRSYMKLSGYIDGQDFPLALDLEDVQQVQRFKMHLGNLLAIRNMLPFPVVFQMVTPDNSFKELPLPASRSVVEVLEPTAQQNRSGILEMAEERPVRCYAQVEHTELLVERSQLDGLGELAMSPPERLKSAARGVVSYALGVDEEVALPFAKRLLKVRCLALEKHFSCLEDEERDAEQGWVLAATSSLKLPAVSANRPHYEHMVMEGPQGQSYQVTLELTRESCVLFAPFIFENLTPLSISIDPSGASEDAILKPGCRAVLTTDPQRPDTAFFSFLPAKDAQEKVSPQKLSPQRHQSNRTSGSASTTPVRSLHFAVPFLSDVGREHRFYAVDRRPARRDQELSKQGNPSIALESVLAQKQEDTARSSQHRTPVMRGLVVDGLSFGCCVRTAAEPLRRSKVLSIFPRFFAKSELEGALELGFEGTEASIQLEPGEAVPVHPPDRDRDRLYFRINGVTSQTFAFKGLDGVERCRTFHVYRDRLGATLAEEEPKFVQVDVQKITFPAKNHVPVTEGYFLVLRPSDFRCTEDLLFHFDNQTPHSFFATMSGLQSVPQAASQKLIILNGGAQIWQHLTGFRDPEECLSVHIRLSRDNRALRHARGVKELVSQSLGHALTSRLHGKAFALEASLRLTAAWPEEPPAAAEDLMEDLGGRWRQRLVVTGEFSVVRWHTEAFVTVKAMVEFILEDLNPQQQPEIFVSHISSVEPADGDLGGPEAVRSALRDKWQVSFIAGEAISKGIFQGRPAWREQILRGAREQQVVELQTRLELRFSTSAGGVHHFTIQAALGWSGVPEDAEAQKEKSSWSITVQVPVLSVSWIHRHKEVLALRFKGIHLEMGQHANERSFDIGMQHLQVDHFIDGGELPVVLNRRFLHINSRWLREKAVQLTARWITNSHIIKKLSVSMVPYWLNLELGVLIRLLDLAESMGMKEASPDEGVRMDLEPPQQPLSLADAKHIEVWRLETLVVEPLRLTIMVRSPDPAAARDNTMARRIRFLPVDMPNMDLKVDQTVLSNQLGSIQQILGTLGSQYKRKARNSALLSVMLSYMAAILKGSVNALWWLARGPYDALDAAMQSEERGWLFWVDPLVQGLSEGTYRALAELVGNALFGVVLILNSVRQVILGVPRPRAQSFLDGLLQGCFGLVVDTFVTPMRQLVLQTQIAYHDWGVARALLVFALCLVRVLLGPALGVLHLAASSIEGLANLLLHEEAQFAPFEMQRTLEPETTRTVTGVPEEAHLSTASPQAAVASDRRVSRPSRDGTRSFRLGEGQQSSQQSWWKRTYGRPLNTLTEMLADDDAVMDRMQLPVQYALNP